MTIIKEGGTGTCRQACVVALIKIKWKGRHVSSADWLRDSMWKVPGHQDLWAYLQKSIFWEKGWLHVDDVYGYIFFFIIDFLVRLSCSLNSFFFPLRWIKIGNTVSEGYRMEFLSATDSVAVGRYQLANQRSYL